MDNIHPQICLEKRSYSLLESIIKSPYKYDNQQQSGEFRWKHQVQLVVNQIVQHYYHLPSVSQNIVGVLRLVERYWKNVSPDIFHSKVDYCVVLAKTTDHLLQFLPNEKKQFPQLYLYQQSIECLKGIGISLLPGVELTEFSRETLVLRKYLVDGDEDFIRLSQQLLSVYSIKVFGKLPKMVEIITLMEGEKIACSPTMDDVSKGIIYTKKLHKNGLKRREEN